MGGAFGKKWMQNKVRKEEGEARVTGRELDALTLIMNGEK